MKFDAVIFDMDGVLVDTEFVNTEMLEAFFRTMGVDMPRAVSFPLVGSTGDLFWQPMLKYANMSMDSDVVDAKFQDYVRACDLEYALYRMPHAIEALTELKRAGRRLAVASSTVHDKAMRILTQCGLPDFFERIVTGERFAKRKPDPEIYLTTARELGLDPARCLAVEDSPYGIEAGKRAGMTVIARRETRFGGDQSKADALAEDLSRIPSLIAELEGL